MSVTLVIIALTAVVSLAALNNAALFAIPALGYQIPGARLFAECPAVHPPPAVTHTSFQAWITKKIVYGRRPKG